MCYQTQMPLTIVTLFSDIRQCFHRKTVFKIKNQSKRSYKMYGTGKWLFYFSVISNWQPNGHSIFIIFYKYWILLEHMGLTNNNISQCVNLIDNKNSHWRNHKWLHRLFIYYYFCHNTQSEKVWWSHSVSNMVKSLGIK